MNLRLLLGIIALTVFHPAICQISIEDIQIDTTISGFSFAIDYSGTKVYTPNGESDLKTKNPTAFSFTLMNDATYEKASQQIGYMIKMAFANGYQHSDIIEKDTLINGNEAFYISMTQTLESEDYKNLVFYGFQIKDKTALLFISGDLDNGKYIDVIRQTFFATKL